MALVDIQISGLPELRARFTKLPGEVHAETVAVAGRVAKMIEDQAKTNVARLFRNPEKMISAIGSEVVDDGETVTAVVNASGRITGVELPYMAIHEFGGTTRPHAIVPRDARVLAFFAHAAPGARGLLQTTGMVFTPRVAHPGSRIPERSYLRAALRERQAEAVSMFREALTSVVIHRRGTSGRYVSSI